jgi:hypothetical protein
MRILGWSLVILVLLIGVGVKGYRNKLEQKRIAADEVVRQYAESLIEEDPDPSHHLSYSQVSMNVLTTAQLGRPRILKPPYISAVEVEKVLGKSRSNENRRDQICQSWQTKVLYPRENCVQSNEAPEKLVEFCYRIYDQGLETLEIHRITEKKEGYYARTNTNTTVGRDYTKYSQSSSSCEVTSAPNP